MRARKSAFRICLTLVVAACGRSDKPRVTVTIPAGATLDAAVDSLAAHGVIRHTALFGLYARLRGLGGSLKSGDYLLRPDAAWSDVVAALGRGHGIEVRWTVPEGLMLGEVATLAAEALGVPGYPYPTTYTLPLHVGARELIRVMIRDFREQWQPEWEARLDSLHMTRYQIVTLASIIEAEVRYDPDRPFVAAVYHNRLRRRMRLEADPTVIYAYGRRLKRVWEKNLAIASPYNTYLHAGLPPGPIGEPGRASLLAALYPAPLPFLFFVAQPDGKHIFSVTLAQHEAAIRTVKRMRSEARGRRPPGRWRPRSRPPPRCRRHQPA